MCIRDSTIISYCIVHYYYYYYYYYYCVFLDVSLVAIWRHMSALYTYSVVIVILFS